MYTSNLLTTPKYLAVLAVCLYILRLVYRLTLHPLARYPGPIICKISSWPDVFAVWRGNRHLWHYELHCKYGHTVRFSPDSLSFDTVGALNDIYIDRHANLKKAGYTVMGEYVRPPHMHTTSDKIFHAAKRKQLSKAFSERALKDYEVFQLEKIREACEILGSSAQKAWSKPFDMRHQTSLLTVDTLTTLTLGNDVGAMAAGHSDIPAFLMDGVKSVNDYAYLPQPLPWLVWPMLKDTNAWFLRSFSTDTAHTRTAYRQTVMGLTKERIKLEEQAKGEGGVPARADFFHHVLSDQDPENGEPLSPQAYVGEASLLIGAGVDAISNSISATLFYLLRNPDKLAKLEREVRKTFTDVEDITLGPQLLSCTYLRACIDEALRRSSPFGGLSRVIEKGGATIDGHSLPEGTIVSMSSYQLHHNEDYNPDAFSYLPERWLTGERTPYFETTEESVGLTKTAFMPFSAGPRGCIGKYLAYNQMLMFLARVVFLYDMRFSMDGPTGGGDSKATAFRRNITDEYQLQDHFVTLGHGPTVQFRSRLD